MPWDSDIDVQMTERTMHFLASYYNMTLHAFKGRDFMLEINPSYVDGSYDDYLNVIDGRWIDTRTGLFIDITAVRPKNRAKDVVGSKDKHEEKVGHPSVYESRWLGLTDGTCIADPRSLSTARQSIPRHASEDTIRLRTATFRRVR